MSNTDNNDPIVAAWAEVPGRYIPDDHCAYDLASVIRAMAHDLNAHATEWEDDCADEAQLKQAAREGYEHALTDVGIAMRDVMHEPGRWKWLSGWVEGRRGWVEA